MVRNRRHQGLSPSPLPQPPTPLIGRAQELAAARQLLSDGARLLSLIGAPGVGKTRLALAIASEVQYSFPHGAWFVDLSTVSDPALLPPTIARTLGVREGSGRPVAETLAAYLRERGLLVLLDNFEQLLPAAVAVAELLSVCPSLVVLVTSRERLGLRSEQTLAVPPLALPDPGLRDAPSLLAAVPSVALFVARCRAIRPDFALTSDNAATVAELCSSLDGLPLAIELAAARANVLAPAELLARLRSRPTSLAWDAPDTPERHRTIGAAIGWSYGLLAEDERALFRRLGAFAGGWTLDAARAVADTGNDPLNGIASLVDKSLVQVSLASGEGGRFGMLETVRAFAAEQLVASGEETSVRRRHARHFLALAEMAAPSLKGSEQAIWLRRLEAELGNFRAALRWSLDTGEPEVPLRLGAALAEFSWLCGHLGEGRRVLEEALTRQPGGSPTVRARALGGLGMLALWQHDTDAASAALGESLLLARALADGRLAAAALTYLGFVAEAQGVQDAAAARFSEALATAQAAEDRWGEAYALRSLGPVALGRGDPEQAVAILEASLAEFRALGDQRAVLSVLVMLSWALMRRDEPAAAAARLAEGLMLGRDIGDVRGIAHAADVALTSVIPARLTERMVRLLGAVDALRQQTGVPGHPQHWPIRKRLIADARSRLGDSRFATAWALGRLMPAAEVVRQILSRLAGVGRGGGGEPASEGSQRPQVGIAGVPLSAREREVLQLLARGHTNRQIAEALTIGERTVRFHMASIFNKFGVDNRTRAVAIATRYGLLRTTNESSGREV